jgi:hypothetical protein
MKAPEQPKTDLSYIETIKQQLNVIDATVRRKVIYNGKMAPKGYVFIVVNIKTERKKYEASQLIKGGQGEKIEEVISSGLLHGLKMRYGV